MSTLKAARADNFYFPPDGSKNPLVHGEFKMKTAAPDGSVTVRYETPFHVRCEKCENMIGKGVRFNARKHSIGKYHTTTIWEF
jgi:coiled-coil domain-containing protein 130